MDAYSLGQLLKKAREDRELSLEDAKNKTRIAVSILESFEQGTFQIADLSPVQIRGMLSNYALYLNLDTETILNHYSDTLAAGARRRRGGQPAARRPAPETRPASETRRPSTDPRRTVGEPTQSQRPDNFGTRREKRRRRGRGFLNLLVILVLTLASFAVIALIVAELLQRTPNNTDAAQTSTGNTIADLPATFTFTPRPSPTPLRTATLAARSVQNYRGEPVMVTVDFIQRTWVRMTVDGAELFSGLVRPGELTLVYTAVNEIILSSSNAEALIVTYNGQPQNSYGGRGQSVEIVYRPNGNVNIETGSGYAPTSEFSATPSPTSMQLAATLLAEGTPTATDGPSPTPSMTHTSSPSPEFSPIPSETPTETLTPTVTSTITASATFTITPTPTATATSTSTPLPTAIVPPRVTAVNATPAKTP